ncbi:MAG: peptidase M15, partial [Acidobacteria bacterium]|nr:peptidase M15 [Acidobacteriota bacterium]
SGCLTLQRWHRGLLRREMERQGFQVYEHEWWHFDYRGWERYAIGNTPHEQLGRNR